MNCKSNTNSLDTTVAELPVTTSETINECLIVDSDLKSNTWFGKYRRVDYCIIGVDDLEELLLIDRGLYCVRMCQHCGNCHAFVQNDTKKKQCKLFTNGTSVYSTCSAIDNCCLSVKTTVAWCKNLGLSVPDVTVVISQVCEK